jgi:hypothetical protein
VANADTPLRARALAEAFRVSDTPALRAYADTVEGLAVRQLFTTETLPSGRKAYSAVVSEWQPRWNQFGYFAISYHRPA